MLAEQTEQAAQPIGIYDSIWIPLKKPSEAIGYPNKIFSPSRRRDGYFFLDVNKDHSEADRKLLGLNIPKQVKSSRLLVQPEPNAVWVFEPVPDTCY